MKWAVLVVLLSAASADANTPRVQLEIDACVDDVDNELERVVRIELGDSLAATPDAADELPRATVRCEPASVILHVDDPITHRSVWRRVAWPAEPRLVALALVELIAASGTELAPPEPPAPSREVVTPSEVTPYSKPPTQRSLRAQLTAGALRFSAADSTLVGVRLRLSAPTRATFGWMLDGQGHHGSDTTVLGELSTNVLAVGAGAQLQVVDGRTHIELGVGARGGFVHVTGMPSLPTVQGGSFWSRWFGPMALASVGYRVADRLAIESSLEAGYVATPVRAMVGNEWVTAVDGSWLQLHVGLAAQL